MLTENDLRAVIPAAFSEINPMTDKYVQINTYSVIAALAEAGYHPVQAQQDKPTRRDPRFVTHKCVLRHEDDTNTKAAVDEVVPQIILTNSHNGRSMMRLFAGFYRFVCANGMVVGDDMYRYQIPHWGDAVAEAMSFAELMGKDLNKLRNVIDEWGAIELTTGQAHTFAQRAAELRFGERAKSYKPEALLEAVRTEDEGNSLWKVFNVVQEKTTQGGIEGLTANSRRVSSKALTSIQPNIAYNSALWNLAGEFAMAA